MSDKIKLNVEPKSNVNAFIVAVVSAIIGSIITIVGQPYLNEKFESQKNPIISKEIYQPSIDLLPQELKSQITTTTTRYSLKHFSGSTGKNITILIKGKDKISPANFIASPDSEPNIIKVISPTQLQVNIQKIRPKGIISLELTHSPNNEISWEERIEEGKVNSKNELEQEKDFFNKNDTILFILIVIILFLFTGLAFLASKWATKLLDFEESQKSVERGHKLFILSMLLLVLGFNFLARFFAKGGLPVFSLSDITYAIIIYLLITNYINIKSRFLLTENFGAKNSSNDEKKINKGITRHLKQGLT